MLELEVDQATVSALRGCCAESAAGQTLWAKVERCVSGFVHLCAEEIACARRWLKQSLQMAKELLAIARDSGDIEEQRALADEVEAFALVSGRISPKPVSARRRADEQVAWPIACANDKRVGPARRRAC